MSSHYNVGRQIERPARGQSSFIFVNENSFILIAKSRDLNRLWKRHGFEIYLTSSIREEIDDVLATLKTESVKG